MQNVFLTALPLFLLIALGIGLRRVRLADDRWVEILNNYGLYAAFPALIFKSILELNSESPVSGRLIGLNLVLLTVVLVGLYILFKAFKVDKSIALAFAVCGTYGNVAYLGFPFIVSVLPGSQGIIMLHIAIYLFVLFTFGLFLMERAKSGPVHTLRMLQTILKNPLFLSMLLALGLHAMHIVFPKPAMTALGMLGASASPAVLVSLGIFMGQGFILNKTLFYSAGLTLAKLVLLPLLFILVLKATGLYGSDAARVSVLEAGMPCGLTAFALSQSYPMDRDCIAQAVIISTFLSMITLPLLAAMM